MRNLAILSLALLAVSSPSSASPLVDDAIPPDSVAAVGGWDSVGSFARPADLPAAPPAPALPPLPDPAEESLFLHDEGDDAEAGAVDTPVEAVVDEALRIDAGLVPAADLAADEPE